MIVMPLLVYPLVFSRNSPVLPIGISVGMVMYMLPLKSLVEYDFTLQQHPNNPQLYVNVSVKGRGSDPVETQLTVMGPPWYVPCGELLG